MQNLREFFSLNASEARTENQWSNVFLPGWNGYQKEHNNLPPVDRECILLKHVTGTAYDLVTPIDFDNPVQEPEELKIEFKPVSFPLFAVYSSSLPRKISYYESFYDAKEEIKLIVRIHERMHAFHHVNNHGVWENFGDVSSVYKEFLAQLFTFKCVENTYLQPYFIKLSKGQPSIYQTWIWCKDFTHEEVFNVFLKIRNEGKSGNSLLDKYAELYHRINEENTSNIDKPEVEILPDPLVVFLDAERAVIHFHESFSKNQKQYQGVLENTRVDIALTDNVDEVW